MQKILLILMVSINILLGGAYSLTLEDKVLLDAKVELLKSENSEMANKLLTSSDTITGGWEDSNFKYSYKMLITASDRIALFIMHEIYNPNSSLVKLLNMQPSMLLLIDANQKANKLVWSGYKEKPVLAEGFSGDDQMVEEGQSVTLMGDINDSSFVTFQWKQTGGTSVALSNIDTLGTSFVAPNVVQDENLTFELNATDSDGNSVSDSVTIMVNKFYQHNIMLRVVRVTEDWMPYTDTSGWTQAAPTKESSNLKYYEAAIWEETASVHLYAFDNDYEPGYSYSSDSLTDKQKIDYREAYMVMKFENMPDANDYEARSSFLKNAFIEFANYLVEKHPDSDHHLEFNGHGGPGGRLFEAMLQYDDASALLAHWSGTLGHNLGVVDMGGPCDKSGYLDLLNFCQYADYYIASDLPNGGYTMDEWTYEKYKETDPDHQYPTLFASYDNLQDVLSKRIDIKRKVYEYSINNMIANKTEQANYLYHCQSFNTFAQGFAKFMEGKSNYSYYDDVLNYLNLNSASSDLIQKYNAIIIRSATNRDFFDWEVEANGILMTEPMSQ